MTICNSNKFRLADMQVLTLIAALIILATRGQQKHAVHIKAAFTELAVIMLSHLCVFYSDNAIYSSTSVFFFFFTVWNWICDAAGRKAMLY